MHIYIQNLTLTLVVMGLISCSTETRVRRSSTQPTTQNTASSNAKSKATPEIQREEVIVKSPTFDNKVATGSEAQDTAPTNADNSPDEPIEAKDPMEDDSEKIDEAPAEESEQAEETPDPPPAPVFDYKLTQQVLSECIASDGAAAIGVCVAGLKALPTGVDQTMVQAQVDSCIADEGATNLETCMLRRGDLYEVNQSDINDCVTNFGGQAMLANCLDQKKMLPSGLLQADLDTCIANSGLQMAETCLRREGFATLKFSSDLHGLFVASCMGCHGNSGNFTLNNMADGDYQVLTNNMQRVNPGDPNGSTLCAKASNQTRHFGGQIWAVGSAEHTMCLRWIEEGAKNRK